MAYAPRLRTHLEQQQYAAHTIKQWCRMVEAYEEWLGARGVLLEDTTEDECWEWINAGHSPSNRRWRYQSLSALYKMLLKRRLVSHNPLEHITQPKEPEVPQPILGDEDLEALVATCGRRQWVDLRDAALILTMASCGARRSELVHFDVGDVVLDVGVPSVRIRKPGKGGRWRMSYLDDAAVVALRRWLKRRPAVAHDALWVSERGLRPMTSDGIYQMIQRRAERAGVRATPQMFRRRFAAKWLVGGGSETGLKQAAGWSRTSAMPSKYAFMALDDIAASDHDRIFNAGEDEVDWRTRHHS
jgi:integrase/recombinase XerC